MKKSHDGYRIVPFPRMRRLMITVGRVTSHKHTIRGLVEIDVTRARQSIREHKAGTGETLSFTAFLAACVGHAVDMNKEVHAYRNWRSQLVLFDDVDIHIQVERDMQGQRSSLPLIVRAANRKTVRDIHEEIRAAQAHSMSGREVKAYMHTWVTLLPSFVQQKMFWVASKSPHLFKQNMGTVELNAIGMFGNRGGWGIHVPFHTLSIVVGGIARKPGVVDERIEIREYLNMTINFDHDMIDGVPAARFVQQLSDLIESGYGLDDSTIESEQTVAPGTSKKISSGSH
jgi:pyruvate/2-oxoglutarate dehydrogenase complex dihydrolipoamide acyltransferase (E2) component